MRLIARALMVIFILIVVALGSSLAYQSLEERRDRRSFPPPGELIDVGGYKLHLEVQGAEHQGPTVLLEHGASSTAAQWGVYQPAIAQFARVVSYDRPGLGYSEAPPRPLTAQQFSVDLLTALTKAGVKGPYIVVGHSLGGLYALAFAEQHPNETAGVVLLDPVTTDNATFLRDVLNITVPQKQQQQQRLGKRLQPQIARFGVMRLLQPNKELVQQFPARSAGELRAALASYHHWAGVVPDLRLGDQQAPVAAQSTALRDKPVLVYSAGLADNGFTTANRQRFTAVQQQTTAGRSTRTTYQTLSNANHYSILTQPAAVQTVVAGIRRLVAGQ